MVPKQTLVSTDPSSRSTVTTIGQSSHIVNKVEQAFAELARRENISPAKKETKKAIKALKEKKSLATDDILLLGVIVFLVTEGYKDKSLISTLFWLFMD